MEKTGIFVMLLVVGVVVSDTVCPGGRKPAPCTANPCIADREKCANRPSTAHCVANYCSDTPCLAEWFVGGVQVECES